MATRNQPAPGTIIVHNGETYEAREVGAMVKPGSQLPVLWHDSTGRHLWANDPRSIELDEEAAAAND